jgi:hypothetical protein
MLFTGRSGDLEGREQGDQEIRRSHRKNGGAPMILALQISRSPCSCPSRSPDLPVPAPPDLQISL